jgi:isoprenylcysteine carboxyl methyltransferase (ICMT) family protein YpbQ
MFFNTAVNLNSSALNKHNIHIYFMTSIIILFSVFFVLRIGTLLFSIKNEKRLKIEGAVEYGKLNSLFMAILHVLFYFGSLAEALIRNVPFDNISIIGIALFVFSYLVLLYVIYQLREIWTVKLFIAKNHPVNTSFLFKYVRHPNYFLNIIPELIGIGLLCKAWHVMIMVLPFYAVTMIVRIIQEERVMRKEINRTLSI